MQMRLFLTALILGGAVVAAPTPDELMRSSDHKKLGKDVAAYWIAMEERKGIAEAFDDLSDSVAKADAKLQKKGPPILTAVEDWRAIFWMATAEALKEKDAKKGKVTEETTGGRPFTYWVDKKVRASNGPMPLVLVVPDEGEDPAAVIEELSGSGLGTQAILVAAHMREFSGSWDSAEAGFFLMETLGSAVQKNMFGFDYDRILLLGRGKGYGPAASLAAQFTYLFAGLAGHGDIPMVAVANFLHLPTYVGGGGESAAIAKVVDDLGFGNCTQGSDDLEATAAWVAEQKRNAYPTEITFFPATAQSRQSYWLSASGIDMDSSPKVKATADPASNKITIEASGVGTLRLLFNDRIANLDETVIVEINGVEHRKVTQRNLRWMIERAYNEGDWARVFTTQANFEVTVPDDTE